MNVEIKQAEPNENFFQRWTAGEIEFGFYQVLFGVRFRAGYIGDGFVAYDWCCGTSQINMQFAKHVFETNLKNCDSYEELFNSLPPCSALKPFDKDVDFVNKLSASIIKAEAA